ncbi:phosphonoacetaldehyde hydrolase [Sphingomonas sp. 8AM]|uniref:phosphonoacetaldehyde hydrolase n=1 Tax=Sphingomonas sp. 8AM TaxID=2653170 RepID=UPI0012F001F8|nr:phosphonoacetaldehyde hydrolase [Sphingomonas sp. 8AM]VXC93098.1 Phosphonoacetaldehyde hydrolase [Sphingomonas sp. 8AM]
MIDGLKAVVFDWAGTMIDFGSRAPVVALLRAFADAGVPIDECEARADMGLAKGEHIAAILATARVAAAWRAVHGAEPTAADAARLLERIGPIMRDAARDTATLIPGAADVVARLRAAGVRTGSCTGYTRAMMEDVLPRAAAQGYAPDHLVCAGETPSGRPSPLMLWANLIALDAWPVTACVKVDDAVAGIAEGRAAGVWTIGVAATGNAIGLDRGSLEALDAAERQRRIEAATAELRAAGAHEVVDSVADLPAALVRLPIG